MTIRVAGKREAAAFRAADEALAGYLIVDFDGFDEWYEEDERNVGHPRDPFHRIDIVHSSRHVRVERDGVVLAESSDPYLLFEPPIPVRYYLRLVDVLARQQVDLLHVMRELHLPTVTLGEADATLDWVDVRDLVAVARTTIDARLFGEIERRIARRGKYQRGRAANLLGFSVRLRTAAHSGPDGDSPIFGG